MGTKQLTKLKYKVDADRDRAVSYDSRPMHRMKDMPRYLEGNSLTKHDKETDSQRQKLYDADRHAPVGEGFDSIKEVAEEIASIFERAWWQRRYASGPIIVQRKGRRRSNAKGTATDGRLKFSPRGFRQRTIIHELIHLTVPLPHAAHGRLFCARYLEAISWWLGEEAGAALKEGYREHGVRWQPRRKHHAGHLSESARREILDGECPDWADREAIRKSKGVRPKVLV